MCLHRTALQAHCDDLRARLQSERDKSQEQQVSLTHLTEQQDRWVSERARLVQEKLQLSKDLSAAQQDYDLLHEKLVRATVSLFPSVCVSVCVSVCMCVCSR